MTLLEALRQYTVIPNEKEAEKHLLGAWIEKYDQRINRRGFVGDSEHSRYWISLTNFDLNINGDCGNFREPITMLQLARLCDIDYAAWMPPKKPVENTERLEKAIREYEESKKKSTPDPLANLLTQIHISFDGMTTHCVVKDRTGVVARSKAVCVGEDQESYDQLVGTIVSIYNLIPREQQMELMDRVMEVMQVGVDVEINPEAKLVDMRNE